MKALIAHLFRAEPRGATLAILFGLASGASAAAMAVIISLALTTENRGTALAAWFFGAAALNLVLRILSETRLIALTQKIVLDMRVNLAHRVLATSQLHLQQIGRQPLLTIQTRDIDAFAGSVQLIPLIVGNLLMIVGCFAYLGYENWRLCLTVVACLLVGATAFRLAERGPLIRLARLRNHIDQLYIHQRALIEGTKELQLNHKRGVQFIDKVLGPVAADVARDYVGAMSSYIWVASIGNSLFYLVIGVVLFGPTGIGSADLVPAVLVMLYLIKPVSEVMIGLPPLRQSAIALEQISRLQADLTADPGAVPRPLEPETIALQGATHSYQTDAEDGTFTLGPVDLSVRRGEVLFLLGGNGSGKTTLGMLLCGLYAPDQGRLLADGTEITPENLINYRQAFSAVFSDFHLFEHLPGADDPAMEERARHYIRHLRMDHKVRVEKGRLSTTDLSTGQRKRLSLVSAYLEDRPFCLFDEWAADQDPLFKAVFYNELLPELKARGKGVIVISHDDAYFSAADRVVKLADGKLVEGQP